MQRAPSSLLRAADRGRDVAVGEVGHVAQHDRRALARRQLPTASPQRLVRAHPASSAHAVHGRGLRHGKRAAGARAVGVERLAVRDRQHPRAQVRVRAQARVGAQRRDEGLLEAVLGLACPPRRPGSATRCRDGRRGSAERAAAAGSRSINAGGALGVRRYSCVGEEARAARATQPPGAHQPPQRRRRPVALLAVLLAERFEHRQNVVQADRIGPLEAGRADGSARAPCRGRCRARCRRLRRSANADSLITWHTIRPSTRPGASPTHSTCLPSAAKKRSARPAASGEELSPRVSSTSRALSNGGST